MKEPLATINPEDVYWTMEWGENHPRKPPTETMFEQENALAVLLANEVIFLNSHWWYKDWPKAAQDTVVLAVNCNDLFAWACADAEECNYEEIRSLYDAWIADKNWGVSKWCCIKRNQKPQPPIVKDMKKCGAWDDVMEALPDNYRDAEVAEQFANLPNMEVV